MRKRFLKTAALAAGCLGWIGAVTMAEPVQQWASGWFWTPTGESCVEVCRFAWDDPYNWEFKGWYVPLYDYPQMENDDAYLTWQADADPVVELSTETIDACVFYVGPGETWATVSVTFESTDSPANGLTCDHVRFVAANGDALITAADNAEIRTVD